MKKRASFFTAMFMLAMCTHVSVSAAGGLLPSSGSIQELDSVQSLTEKEDGSAAMTVYSNIGDFVIVTDGSDLPDITEAFPGCIAEEMPEVTANWKDKEPETLKNKDSLRYFVLTGYHPAYTILGNPASAAEIRAYRSAYSEVLEVMVLNCEATANVKWNGTFSSSLLGTDEMPDVTAFDGYAEAMQEMAVLQETQSDYELLCSATDTAKKLQYANAEKCWGVFADAVIMETDENTAVYSYTTAWDGIGDINGDGVINALDASEILMYAVTAGSGAEEARLYEREIWRGDINADRLTDAADATCILKYITATGTGYTGTLDMFMQQSNL